MKTKRLSLRPYYGAVIVCKSLDDLRKQYKKFAKEKYPYDDKYSAGRYVRIISSGEAIWLVWAQDKTALAHEFCHVLLHTFGEVGHNPTAGDGEPFCYMLSALLKESP